MSEEDKHEENASRPEGKTGGEASGDPLGRDPFEEERDSVWKTPEPARTPQIIGGERPGVDEGETPPDDQFEYAEPPWTPVAQPPRRVGPPVAPKGAGADEAAKNADDRRGEKILTMVGLSVGDELYGVDINVVREIIRLTHITPAPGADPHVLGVINLRGEVIPVISLRRRLGYLKSAATKTSRIVILDLPGGMVGAMVDAVLDLIRVPASDIGRSAAGGGAEPGHVTGIVKVDDRMVISLDIEKAVKSA